MTQTLAQLDIWTKLSAALLLGFTAFVCYDQYYYWSTQAEYSFGYIVPLFVGFVLNERWPKIKGYLLGTDKSYIHAPRTGAATALEGLFGLGLVLALGLFMLGGAIRISQGPGNLASLLIAVGFGGIVLGLIFINSGTDAEGKSYALKSRLALTFLFLFPALVWLISAPMVMYLDSDVKLILMEWVSVIVFHTFDFLGLSITRQGNTLILPQGVVGVADACSGVRSLTGCIFAGSFLAAVFLNKLWKKVLLLVMAVLLAFVTNILRSLFLTGWAYAYGSEAIDDKIFTAIGGGTTLHDFTGYAVLGLTCVFLVMLLPLFNFTIAPPDDDEDNLASEAATQET